MRLPRLLSLIRLLLGLAALSGGLASPAAAALQSAEPLPPELWLPGAAQAERVVYATVGADGQPATSSGAYFLPAGDPPAGGWPVVAWAHGTSGLADQCAPSRVGPTLPQRDRPYLGQWLARGYAILASDYAGLGTPGVHAYLNQRVAARNVVDMVGAVADARPGVISRRWMVVGQSQGGGVAVVTARYATQFGQGAGLDYVGGVATGVPAYIEQLLSLVGPGIPPFPLGPDFSMFVLFMTAGLRASYPQIDVNAFLTPRGRALVDRSETLCPLQLRAELGNVVLGTLFRRPIAQLPGGVGRLREYMGLPERGFDRPLFVGHGLTDTEVITPNTLAWAARMRANGQPLTLRLYPTDHDGAFTASIADSLPFADGLFARTAAR